MVVSDRGEHSINIPHWTLSEIVTLKGNHVALFTFSNLAPFFMMVSDRGEHSINIPHWMLSEIVALKGNHAALFTFSNLAPFFCGFG